MRRILNHKTIAFATLIIWLLASWSGAHGHMCFDGQEPPISVHIDALGGHADHDSSEQHIDADVDLNQPLLAKLQKIDLPLLLIAAFLLTLFITKPIHLLIGYSRKIPFHVIGLRPPLRAPPVFPA